jgi:hypothetical protein
MESVMSEERNEITRLINLYIDGSAKGDADKLNEAFHESARWAGTMGGTDYDMDKKSFIDLIVSEPVGETYTAEIADIQIVGTAATVTVREEGVWGAYAFTDFFNLSILDGRWQITNKTFANTGVSGEAAH